MNITIKVIDNDQHREGITGADWYVDKNGDLQIRVSKMSDPRYEMTLALHELFEAVLCHFSGVTHQQVDAFDIPYEKTHDKKCNAGDEEAAPYRREHMFATAAERIMAGELNVNWIEYEQELEKL